jgi:hypothetical protein
LLVRSILAVSPFRKWRMLNMKQLACQLEIIRSRGLRRDPESSSRHHSACRRRAGANNSGGHIDGVVLNQLTGQPVYKVSVTIWGVSAALTDRDGKFSIGEIPPGRYRIFVEHPGFLATWYRADGLVLISIGAGQSVSNIRIAITPKGVISGRVVDADGDPVTEVSLQLHKWTKKNGARQLAPSTRLDIPTSRAIFESPI